jgi:hypothetical protein
MRYRLRLAWIRWRVRLSALAVLGPLLLVAYSFKLWGEQIWTSNFLRIPTFIFATLIAFVNAVEAWRDKRQEEVAEKKKFIADELRTGYINAMRDLHNSAWSDISLFVLLGKEARKRTRLNYEPRPMVRYDLYRPLYIQESFSFEPEIVLYNTYAVALCWNEGTDAFVADANSLHHALSNNMATSGIRDLVETKNRASRRREVQRKTERSKYWETLPDTLRFYFRYWEDRFIDTGRLPNLSYAVAPLRNKNDILMGCVVIQLPVKQQGSDSLYAIVGDIARKMADQFFP